MNHKTKLKIARKLYTKVDKLSGFKLFYSYAWEDRKAAIAERVKRQQSAAHERAVERERVRKLSLGLQAV